MSKVNIILNPRYQQLESFIRTIPDIFDLSGKIDYSGRNVIKLIEHDGFLLNVKSFKVPHLLNRFIYTNFRESKACRSFKYGMLLVDREIHTPDPVAYIEVKEGIALGRSFYISIHEAFDGIMREFDRGTLNGREDLLRSFARFTADLHNKQILHLDYSPGNILYKKQGDEYTFSLVDLNRMIFDKEVDFETGCYNLRKLFGTDDMIKFIAEEYALNRGFDVDACIQQVLNDFHTFWKAIGKRHQGYLPYFD